MTKLFMIYASALASLGTMVITPFVQTATDTLKQLSRGETEAVSFSNQPGTENSSLPVTLSGDDRALYLAIFEAQKKADWKTADDAIKKLDDPILMGHIQADRYLHRKYQSKPVELAKWLNSYSDHPQAHDIYVLAMAKAPDLKGDVPVIRKPALLNGYGDSTPTVSLSDSPLATTWRSGLNAWRYGDKAEAARIFSSLAERGDSLTSWQKSAIAYWAYRAHHAIGNMATASKYLHRAAQSPRSFYGIIASRQLRQSLELDSSPFILSEGEALEMFTDPFARRVITLAQIGHIDLAERELRHYFMQAEPREKWRLLALAYQLRLASVQIAMARQLGDEDRTLDFARYPIPYWKPHNGFKVEPALIYALARQESGFHTSAVSPYGALGLMQIMPKTASMMQKQMDVPVGGNVSEPSLNFTLGQNYIKHLLENGLVEGNLIYMLTAYNAGPGRLQEWKATVRKDDPLLFIESIPFAETRGYVMQVMANYWIYSELAGQPSQTVGTLASGKWPNYDMGALASNMLAGNGG